MRKEEALKIWEQRNREDEKQHLGSRCYMAECEGRYIPLTKPHTSIDCPNHIAYLECNKCGSHLLHSPFREWLNARRSQAKAHVRDFQWNLQNLKKDLEKLKQRIKEEKIALKVAKQERKRWGY